MKIANLINHMETLGCQLCGEEAKYTCQVYYCGPKCQVKHLSQ